MKNQKRKRTRRLAATISVLIITILVALPVLAETNIEYEKAKSYIHSEVISEKTTIDAIFEVADEKLREELIELHSMVKRERKQKLIYMAEETKEKNG